MTGVQTCALPIYIIISIINLKSIRIREIICGKPRILIFRGRIDEKAMQKENFTITELEARLRVNGAYNLEDVEYAILETSGQITVIPKPNKRGTTPEDFGIEPEYVGMSYDLVIDGKVLTDNLVKLGKDYNWLKKQVGQFHMRPEEALVVVLSGNGSMFCQRKEEK